MLLNELRDAITVFCNPPPKSTFLLYVFIVQYTYFVYVLVNDVDMLLH